MYYKGILFTWLALLPVLLWAQPPLNKPAKKPGFLGRAYHNTHAYYNGYYNAYQLYTEAVTQLESTYQPPEFGFLSLLDIVTEGKSTANDELLQKAIQKCELILFRRTKSDWLDDAHLLIAKCNYYRNQNGLSIKNLEYLTLVFPKSELVPEARLWQAKVYYRMGDIYSTRARLNELFKAKEIPDGVRAEASMFYASLLVNENKLSQAVKVLDDNLEAVEGKKNQARVNFLLGQLYDAQKVFSKAYDHYETCVRINYSDALTFRAQLDIINLYIKYQPELGQTYNIERMLTRLLEDTRYTPFQDQVYYQLALLKRKNKQYTPAIADLKTGLAKSGQNPLPRLRAYYLAGDIYFENLKKWTQAQAYYDSAAQLVQPDYPDYKRIKALASSLSDYVQYQGTIQRQDSLLALSRLPDWQINDRVEAAMDAEEDQLLDSLKQATTASAPPTQGRTDVQQQQQGGFYFDNPTAVALGRSTFASVWGQRPNADNWRRKAALSLVAISGNNPQATTGSGATPGTGVAYNRSARKQQLRNEVPITDTARAVATAALLDATANLAQLFAERLDKPDEAVTLYESLVQRAPTAPAAIRARYALFVLLRESNPEASDRWADELLRDFPTSEYARLVVQVRDPNRTYMEIGDDESSYNTLFGLYKAGDYRTVIGFVDYTLQRTPTHTMAPQMLYLKGLCYGRLEQTDSLQAVYAGLIERYPGTEVATIAKGTLDYLANPNRGISEAGGTTDGTSRPPLTDSGPYKLALAANEQAMVLLFVPKEYGEAANIVRDVNAYNRAAFPEKKLNCNVFAYEDKHLVYVVQFPDFLQANTYLEALKKADALKVYLPKPTEQTVFVSPANFRQAYTTRKFAQYLDWYLDNRERMLGK